MKRKYGLWDHTFALLGAFVFGTLLYHNHFWLSSGWIGKILVLAVVAAVGGFFVLLGYRRAKQAFGLPWLVLGAMIPISILVWWLGRYNPDVRGVRPPSGHDAAQDRMLKASDAPDLTVPPEGWYPPVSVEHRLDTRQAARRVSVPHPLTEKWIDEFPAGTRITFHLYRMHLQPDGTGVTAFTKHPVGDVTPTTTGPTVRQVFTPDVAEKCPDPDGVVAWPCAITNDFSMCLPYPRNISVLRQKSQLVLDVNWPSDDWLCRGLKGLSPKSTNFTPDPWRKSGYGGVSVIVGIELPVVRTPAPTS